MFLEKITKFIILFLVLQIILISTIFAQKTYSGDPVTKNGLVKALKMKQFKSSDMVSIINEQGCEFKLDKDSQEDLVKAGARPEVIEAVRRNYRGAFKIKPTNSKTYEGLISQAINIYESESNANEAINVLNQAISLEPNKYRAYQMMGYVLLYGKRKFKDAEDYMKKAIDLGGSAVFRVSHGHDFSFLNSCSGSVYISQNNVRYEDDNNVHTFQVSKSDILKIETIGAWGSIKNPKTWGDFTKLKKGLFKVLIQDKANVKDKDNYVFAADTGKGDEAKMIVRLVGKN